MDMQLEKKNKPVPKFKKQNTLHLQLNKKKYNN